LIVVSEQSPRRSAGVQLRTKSATKTLVELFMEGWARYDNPLPSQSIRWMRFCHAIPFARDRSIDSAQESTHLFGGTNRQQFDAAIMLDHVEDDTRVEFKRLPHCLRNNDLKLGREGSARHRSITV
jgi:hypothetical protein